ncbi:MAG: hypothetical protein IRY98_09925, partial [Alicyclobacillaceae bacterium]|nr:hypothetical protein [Alicyclobacillaceae bacterium]
MASGILADILLAVGAILLGTGWGNTWIARSAARRWVLASGLGFVWWTDRLVVGTPPTRVNVGGLICVVIALGLLAAAPADIRSWIRQTVAMVLTTSILAVLWAALPYTPLAAWMIRDFVCAGIGGLVAGLAAPSPVLAAASAVLGVVFGVYEVLFVQYHASLRDILWLDADLLDDMTV